ncbi:hypothetical protein ACLOJK_036288 [Asimina triloba]
MVSTAWGIGLIVGPAVGGFLAQANLLFQPFGIRPGTTSTLKKYGSIGLETDLTRNRLENEFFGNRIGAGPALNGHYLARVCSPFSSAATEGGRVDPSGDATVRVGAGLPLLQDRGEGGAAPVAGAEEEKGRENT